MTDPIKKPDRQPEGYQPKEMPEILRMAKESAGNTEQRSQQAAASLRDVSFDGIYDPTGRMFSLAKSIACAVKHSPWADYAEDIIATSGFAFRMWVREDLCPSAASCWDWDDLKSWVDNSGLAWDYDLRHWGEDDLEKAKKKEAIAHIKHSVDRGIPAVSWDIGIAEWGVITGYSSIRRSFRARSPVKGACKLPYRKLGKREYPILCVLTLVGENGKSQDEVLRGTLRMAAAHLRGEEWQDPEGNLISGLAGYPVLLRHFEAEDPAMAQCWEMGYHLGTYGALKYYAWKYFDKVGLSQLASLYQEIANAWLEAAMLQQSDEINQPEGRRKIAALLKIAQENETRAAEVMGTMSA